MFRLEWARAGAKLLISGKSPKLLAMFKSAEFVDFPASRYPLKVEFRPKLDIELLGLVQARKRSAISSTSIRIEAIT